MVAARIGNDSTRDFTCRKLQNFVRRPAHFERANRLKAFRLEPNFPWQSVPCHPGKWSPHQRRPDSNVANARCGGANGFYIDQSCCFRFHV
jgi:hypothetical protein